MCVLPEIVKIIQWIADPRFVTLPRDNVWNVFMVLSPQTVLLIDHSVLHTIPVFNVKIVDSVRRVNIVWIFIVLIAWAIRIARVAISVMAWKNVSITNARQGATLVPTP